MSPSGCRTSLACILWGGLAVIVCSALSAEARQFVPGPSYAFYPDAGVMGAVTSAYQSAAQMEAYNQNRQLQAATVSARSQAWQNINRSMQTAAATPTGAVPDAGQSARDWMFQNAPRSRPVGRPVSLPVTDMAAAPATQISRPETQREIMLWPTVLQEQRFDGERAAIEAPFRRAYADGKPLTIEDYQAIIRTVEKMKSDLRTMAPQLWEGEYAAVEKYLDDLVADAQKRIQARKDAQPQE
jgi:hypothetical protein